MPTLNSDLALEARVKRADMALSDLAANGGLLTPEQNEQFIDMVQDTPTLLASNSGIRFVRMNGPQRHLNRIGFDSRILRAARQTGSALDAGGNDRYVRAADRAKPTTDQIELNTSEVIAEVRLPYEVLEDNIEGEKLQTHLLQLIASRASYDLEELGLAGDTTSGDAYLALQDGWLKRMSLHIVNNLSAGVSPSMFTQGLLAMPQKYLRRYGELRHIVSVANEIRYREAVSARATGYGDSALTQNIDLYAGGVKISNASQLATVNSGTVGFTTFLQNLIFGIQRSVRIEYERDIRSREFIVVVTARVAVQIEDGNACVKYTNI